MRVIPPTVPTFESLNLPEVLSEIVNLRNGIALVTGPTGSGKSSTLAAIVDRMNMERAIHILTIEDPPSSSRTNSQKRISAPTKNLLKDTYLRFWHWWYALRQAAKSHPEVGENARTKRSIAVWKPRKLGTGSLDFAHH